MGRERAKESAVNAIAELGAKVVANLGIAGRVDEDLSIGDVVIPGICFDLTAGGKVSGSPSEVEFQHAPEQKVVTGNLVKIAHTHLKINSRHIDYINDRLRGRFNAGLFPERGIKVIAKPIACVPSVGANDRYRESIRGIHRAIAAMEMESGGILDATSARQIPTICVRGISDGADFNKRALEQGLRDENRRFALEAALAVLEAVLLVSVEEDKNTQILGLELPQPELNYPPGGLGPAEELFSLLIHTPVGDTVPQPIEQIGGILISTEYKGAVVIFGEKGSGKTTFFRNIHRALSARLLTSTTTLEQVPLPYNLLVRMRELEVWSNGEINVGRTKRNLERVRGKILEIAQNRTGGVVILIDGLSRTGPMRIELVASILESIRQIPNTRIAISADNPLDLQSLSRRSAIDIERQYKLLPMDIEDPRVETLIAKFSSFIGVRFSAELLQDMRAKDVRSVDMFILGQFINVFRSITYHGLTTLAQCYKLFCDGEITQSLRLSDADSAKTLAQIAETAFCILISKTRNFVDIKEQYIAQIMASHSSVTNYLVASHVMTVMAQSHSNKTVRSVSALLSFVFPAEVNGYMKQMMRSDQNLEGRVVEFIKKNWKNLSTLAKSHSAYLAGRVSADNSSDMMAVLRTFSGLVKIDQNHGIDRDNRMLRRTIFISRSQLGDHSADLEYADIILNNVEEAEFNRGFHLEYYGDAPFQPDGRMFSRDDGNISCNRTLARLLDRIRARGAQSALIEILTVLSLVQVRNQHRTLRPQDRESVLALLKGEQLSQRHALPPKIRGYFRRVEEDLNLESFSLSTVLQEWIQLNNTPRTGWLRRRGESTGHHTDFWRGLRIESVSEHCFSAMAIAQTFLSSAPNGDEQYSKNKVIEILQIHDLAEAWIGDLLQADPKAEQEVLWQYGAFATYRGIGDLWRIPELFQEFVQGQTIEARIAQDLDRLQFMLQARIYQEGMSEQERMSCERTAGKLVTGTVNRICNLLKDFPGSKRVNQNSILS